MKPTSSFEDPVFALVARGVEFLRTRRPLAAWADWQAALRLDPGNKEASEALDRLGLAPNLPPQATASYRFRPPVASKRAAWDERLRAGDLGALDAAVDAFADLAIGDPEDSPAVFNLALALAWAGRNREAIGALDRVVQLDAESRPDDAVDAWALASLLRQGAGAENLADDLSHSLRLEFPGELGDPVAWLSRIAILRPIASPEPAVRLLEWLDRPMPMASDQLTGDDLPMVRASVVVSGEMLQFSSPVAGSGLATALELVEIDVFEAFSPREPASERLSSPLPLALLDAAIWRFRLPDGLEESTRDRLTRESVERYFEHDWIRSPLTSLDGRAPADVMAGSSAVDHCKVAAAIRFREGLAARPTVAKLYQGYPFDRLRRRLGLVPLNSETIDSSDVSCMGIKELDALDPANLDLPTLLDAQRSARAFPGSAASRKFEEAVADRQVPSPIRGQGV